MRYRGNQYIVHSVSAKIAVMDMLVHLFGQDAATYVPGELKPLCSHSGKVRHNRFTCDVNAASGDYIATLDILKNELVEGVVYSVLQLVM
jgi:hypothetical protein